VVRRATALGIVGPSDVERLTEQQRLDLVFADGLSTAETVTETEISGRGVGANAVLKSVQELGGRVEVRSTSARGTVFEIVLPSVTPL
jgi:two-component system, chemotaxis family, sensor kinase CheA